MKELHIDIECFSSIPLPKTGVYRYSESRDFEILLFGYSMDGKPVHVVDLACGEKIPSDILAALTDNRVVKLAQNSAFERICLSRFLGLTTGEYLNPASWKCTMVWAATMGLPLSLEGAGAVLKLDKQKISEGKDLIRYFCMPCAPTASNGQRTRNLPHHAPDKWEAFKKYNARDIETEMAIQTKLRKFQVPENIWAEYHLDQEINDCGILLDMPLVHNAILCDAQYRQAHMELAREVTGLENPNSTAQMKAWLAEQGMEADSLSKASVLEMLEKAEGNVELALSLRQELAKSSVKKYTAMENAVCRDQRVRGLFQFYGASRTGRWGGRLLQPQNLPATHMSSLDAARQLIRKGDFSPVEMLFDSVPIVLSELIRTAFIPKPGHRFFAADFSAIEARVIAWLAGEDWRLDVFKRGEDIYCASASQMFGVPVEKNGVNGHLRQKGKLAELSSGFGGSVGALKAMGALEMGLQEAELKPIVDAWRSANPNIVQFWWDVDKAVKACIVKKTHTETHGIGFQYQSGFLFITLPSGRRLAYVKPRIEENRFGGESVTYEGVGGTKKWERIESYGPKFVENIVQATARDILAEAMTRLDAEGYRIVMHVHDEVIIEAPGTASLKDVCGIMSETPKWADGLQLRADGFVCEYYKKE